MRPWLSIVRRLFVRVWEKFCKTLRHQYCVCYNRLAHLCETRLRNVLFFLQLTSWFVKVWENVEGVKRTISQPWSCTCVDCAPSHERGGTVPSVPAQGVTLSPVCLRLDIGIRCCLRICEEGGARRAGAMDDYYARCGLSRPCDSLNVQMKALHKLPTNSP